MYKSVKRAVLGIAALLALPGCWGEDRCVLDDAGASWQLSPDGRAVALVDPVAYTRLVERGDVWPEDVNCVIRGFFERFECNAEAIVLLHDIDGERYVLNRLLIESGLDPLGHDDLFSFREAVPDEILEIADTFPRATRKGFNWAFRRPEGGLGPGPEPAPVWAPADFRGYVFLPARHGLVRGLFLHELCHFWAVHLDGPPALAEKIDEYPAHWGFTSVGGVLGGWLPGTLQPRHDDGYRAWLSPGGWSWGIVPYAPLELYLMGLVGAEDVPPIEIATGVDVVWAPQGGYRWFSATSFETVTIEEIVAANGPRIPDYLESDKHFELALVILTDHVLSDTEWGFYERSTDFITAGESRDVLAALPEALYPEYYHVLSTWQELAADIGFGDRDSEQRLLNFHMATGGRGSIEFVQIRGLRPNAQAENAAKHIRYSVLGVSRARAGD